LIVWGVKKPAICGLGGQMDFTFTDYMWIKAGVLIVLAFIYGFITGH
jgi:hypothetical protein